MRALLGWTLALGLLVAPALARTDGAGGNADAGDRTAAGKNDATDAPATPTPPAASRSISAKPEAASVASELEELRDLLEAQSRQLEMQGEQLKQQQQKMQMLEEQLKNTNAVRDASSATAATVQPAANTVSALGGSAGVAMSAAAASSAVSPAVAASSSKPAASPDPAAAAAIGQKIDQDQTESPLQLRIGSAYITPVGFMDFTGVWRQHDGGSGIGTNFASIPYGATSFQGNLSEFRFSMQNSRIGFRVDALVKGAHVMGYMESDFLGNNPGNVAVSSNSNTLRSRLYWVDVQKNKWEVLGGQTWSLITPGRTGISPLPGNLFYTQDIDVNYQLGLVWGRIPELRFRLPSVQQGSFRDRSGQPGAVHRRFLWRPKRHVPGEHHPRYRLWQWRRDQRRTRQRSHHAQRAERGSRCDPQARFRSFHQGAHRDWRTRAPVRSLESGQQCPFFRDWCRRLRQPQL